MILFQLVSYLLACFAAALAVVFLVWGVTYHVRARRDYAEELRRIKRSGGSIHWRPENEA